MWPELLYIPLCFYYIIDASCSWLAYSVFTFHYASTISTRTRGRRTRENLLYIPLCFYYILKLSKPFLVWIHLYIPLCFYYIAKSDQSAAGLLPFTFHYASTISRKGRIPGVITSLYIPLCFYYICWGCYHLSPFYNLYIPLCFYYICIRRFNMKNKEYLYIPLCFYYIQKPGTVQFLCLLYIPLCFYYIRLR